MSEYFDKEGRPIVDVLEWARLFDDGDYRRVAETTLPDGTWVSTVWLGLNHRLGEGPPLIFETMVFPRKGEDGDMERYSTEAEAIAGHEAMVRKWTEQSA